MKFISNKKEFTFAGIQLHVFFNSLFFLFLGVSSNYIGDTFSINLQKLFNDSLVFKQIIVILTIYFGLDLSSDKSLNPFNSITASIYIYSFFTVISHIDYRISVTIMSLLSMLYFENNYTRYQIDNNIMTQKKFDTIMVPLRRSLLISIFILLLFGIILFIKNNFINSK